MNKIPYCYANKNIDEIQNVVNALIGKQSEIIDEYNEFINAYDIISSRMKKMDRIERIMKANSIPFKLPDDYYENDDYKV